MTGEEIKQRFDEIDKQIEYEIDTSSFVLNRKIAELLDEQERLSKECPHEFENGICKYCGRSEE